MALSSSLPNIIYPEEPEIYISSTTINLKPSRILPYLNRTEISENVTFEWHTNVTTTPPNTPAMPIVKEQFQTQNHANNLESVPERTKDLFLPAFTFEETDNLQTKLDKFMSCERYHSTYHQATQRSTNL